MLLSRYRCLLIILLGLVAMIGTFVFAMPQSKPDAAATTTPTEPQSQAILGAYIESLCPDSRRFFLRQLVPANQELGQLFQFKIVPFGHARTLGNNKMTCQHGQLECEGNRKMACVLARASNKTEAIETLGCMFRSLDDWARCVERNMSPGVKVDDIEACSSGAESYKMMEEAEKETGSVGYVPHLTLNGKHDDNIQYELEHNLKRVVCQQYKSEPKPEACKAVLMSQ